MKINEITRNGWLFEDNNDLGIISQKSTGEYMMVSGSRILEFSNIRELKKHLKEQGVDYPISPKEKANVVHYIRGYPVDYPNPILVDSDDGLPLFRKRERKGVNLCAGYYKIWTKKGWRTLYCPKESTLKSYKWKGPYREHP